MILVGLIPMDQYRRMFAVGTTSVYFTFPHDFSHCFCLKDLPPGVPPSQRSSLPPGVLSSLPTFLPPSRRPPSRRLVLPPDVLSSLPLDVSPSFYRFSSQRIVACFCQLQLPLAPPMALAAPGICCLRFLLIVAARFSLAIACSCQLLLKSPGLRRSWRR